MSVRIGIWDLVLVLVVAALAMLLAYMDDPRWKAVFSTLPIPFTVAFLAVGLPITVNNVLGLMLILLFYPFVRTLYQRWSVPIILAIFLAAVSYSLLGATFVALLPASEAGYWLVSVALWLAGIGLLYKSPRRTETGHRSPLPVYVKLPITLALVAGLVVIKGLLAGFATVFPLVTVVAAYEARYSLGTVGRQVPVLIIAMAPMMAIIHLAQPHLGAGLALAAGWLVFLCLYVPVTWAIWFRPEGQNSVLLRQP